MACPCGRNRLTRPAGQLCASVGQTNASRRPANTCCRGFLRCGANGTASAREAAALAAEARNRQYAEPEPPERERLCPDSIAGELYGAGSVTAPVRTTCCDPCGCRGYNIANRDPYWPTFAHPRWLSCDLLYAHGRRGYRQSTLK